MSNIRQRFIQEDDIELPLLSRGANNDYEISISEQKISDASPNLTIRDKLYPYDTLSLYKIAMSPLFMIVSNLWLIITSSLGLVLTYSQKNFLGDTSQLCYYTIGSAVLCISIQISFLLTSFDTKQRLILTLNRVNPKLFLSTLVMFNIVNIGIYRVFTNIDKYNIPTNDIPQYEGIKGFFDYFNFYISALTIVVPFLYILWSLRGDFNEYRNDICNNYVRIGREIVNTSIELYNIGILQILLIGAIFVCVSAGIWVIVFKWIGAREEQENLINRRTTSTPSATP